MAADDAAPAPLVLYPAEHAAIGLRARPRRGACRSSLEDRSGVTHLLPSAADARTALLARGRCQRHRRPRQPVRRHARRAAKPMTTGRVLSRKKAGTFFEREEFPVAA